MLSFSVGVIYFQFSDSTSRTAEAVQATTSTEAIHAKVTTATALPSATASVTTSIAPPPALTATYSPVATGLPADKLGTRTNSKVMKPTTAVKDCKVSGKGLPKSNLDIMTLYLIYSI